MITIRLWFEISTPAGEVVERFPVIPGELMVLAGSKKLAILEKIKVDSKTDKVKAVADTDTIHRICLGLGYGPNDLPDRNLVTLRVDVIEEPGEEPREEAPLLPESHG